MISRRISHETRIEFRRWTYQRFQVRRNNSSHSGKCRAETHRDASLSGDEGFTHVDTHDRVENLNAGFRDRSQRAAKCFLVCGSEC